MVVCVLGDAEDEFVDCGSVVAGVVVAVGAGVVVLVSVCGVVSAAGASSAYTAIGAPPTNTTDMPINSND